MKDEYFDRALAILTYLTGEGLVVAENFYMDYLDSLFVDSERILREEERLQELVTKYKKEYELE